jgi:Tol biopolymer transport system component/predicted Ser/Thr protein kinase
MLLAPGTTLDRFEIRSLLGEGGMGEVYLARDTADGRLVALKLLPPEFASNPDRLRRFGQEAHAASALSHHNIVSVYEVGQVAGTPFISMEFVEGETLRQFLRRSAPSFGEVIDIAVQVAEALDAAHASGIVHRDIKPENVIVCEGQHVKVLDFGLAKLLEPAHNRDATPEASTMTNFNTGPGTVLGTTSYMSPEQLRGQGVDARTDIWSLGVLLYELLTGELPFCGHSANEVVVSILEREPRPVSLCRPGVPIGLERIVGKAMRKRLEERYQKIGDMLSDLVSLRDGGEIQDDDEDGEVMLRTAQQSAADTDPAGTYVTEMSDGLPLAPPRSLYKVVSLVLLPLITAGVMVGAALRYGGNIFRRPAGPGPSTKVSKVIFHSNAREAVISPDGKFIAATLVVEGRQSIWLRELATTSDLQLVAPSEEQYKGLTFSPDGAMIYFMRQEQEDGTLFRVARLGGPAQKVAAHVNSPAALSPDGKLVAFVRNYFEGDSTALVIANADRGGGERELAKRRLPEAFNLGGFLASGPAWSPDGRVIACPVTVNESGGFYMKLTAVNVADGSSTDVPSRRWSLIERIAWLRDGDGLIMNAQDDQTSPTFQVWLVQYPRGDARRVTYDADFYESVSLTHDSSTLVTVQSDAVSDIWSVSQGGSVRAARVTASQYKGASGLAWGPDGRIVYASSEGGNQDIWVMNGDGSGRRRLTFDEHDDMQPSMSGDGRRIAFVSYRTGGAHVWVMDADGGNQTQLTFGSYEDTPYFSPDGKWVIYHGYNASKDSLLKMPVEGGTPVALTRKPSIQPAVSPDGKEIACYMREDSPDSPWKLVVISSDGGEILKVFDVPAAVGLAGQAIRWTVDGAAVTYVANLKGVSNIWNQPLGGGLPRSITDFGENQIFSFAWAADGKQLICARGLMVRDVVLRKDFLDAPPT